MSRARNTLFVAAISLFMTALAFAADSDFHWQGKLAADKVVEIRGISGDIKAAAADGDQVTVDAHKSGARSDQVKVEVVEHAEGVTICAVYPSGESGYVNSCTSGSSWHSHVRDNDARVDFTVRVPRNLRFSGKTVNGSVAAEGMGRKVEASTVNGSVNISTAEWGDVNTVNGSIHARFGRADWTDTLKVSTVNGQVELELPSSFSADVRFRSVNGHFESDFPLTIAGSHTARIGPGMMRLEGRIGSGGRELEVNTVNGDVHLSNGSASD